RHAKAPGLKPGPPRAAVREQRLSRLVEHGPEHDVAGLGDPDVIVALARLDALGCQTGARPYRLGMEEALGLIDSSSVGERHDWANAGRHHQAPAHWIVAHQ